MKRDIMLFYDNDSRMSLMIKTMDDFDWCILIEEVNKREQSWQELGLSWDRNSGNTQEAVEPRFIELVKAIGAHPKLLELGFSMDSIARDNKVDILLEALKDSHSIQHLSITAYEFDLETARAFAQILMNNKKLLSLDISNTYCINPDESSVGVNAHDLMEKIFEASNENHCICYLNINESPTNYVSNAENGELYLWYLRDDHILELFHELKKFPDRNWSIRLASGTRLTSIGYRRLRDILSSTIKVVEFETEANYMNEEAQANLFSGLCASKTLQRCTLLVSKLNHETMDYIGRFIQNNMKLATLNLSCSKIDDDGAVCLAKYLPESSLKELGLRYTLLGDRGCKSLLSSIPSTLTDLSIGNNSITISSLQTILTFLATNQTLKRLEISWNPIFGEDYMNPRDTTVWQQIVEASKQNDVCEID
ncbi:unnamed protein product [Rotaria sp. Silwood2]|nr:unnamed protein product [Rotaria sp. Silwood2]CAF3130556.1 unnamed protein product [Rotaria sp. Silwood2]CAF3272361.1 unnamed protein product [Rotaria sp. Silwood2]CAF4258727.1 unnamed protein product [Rotaria sp. Silwood2]CAF4468466.1 unnamed protein product [Rotaria sp. Silwood2]